MAPKQNNVARLRERIRVDTPQQLDDGQGGYSQVWVELAEVWAEIQAPKPTQNESLPSLKNTRIGCAIRGHLTLTTACRVVWETRIYAIDWISPALDINGLTTMQLREVSDE